MRPRARPPRLGVDFHKEMRKEFLGYLREGFSEAWAKRKTGLGSKRYRKYKDATPSWQKKVDEAKEEGILALEDEATRRGKKGYLRPVVSAGKIVTHVREFSDKLLSEALRAKSPRYASAKSTGADFADTVSQASNRLLDRLNDLVRHAEEADRALLAAAKESAAQTEQFT